MSSVIFRALGNAASKASCVIVLPSLCRRSPSPLLTQHSNLGGPMSRFASNFASRRFRNEFFIGANPEVVVIFIISDDKLDDVGIFILVCDRTTGNLAIFTAIRRASSRVSGLPTGLLFAWPAARRDGCRPSRRLNDKFARDCVVGPRGLELRAKHAVLSNECLILPTHEVAALWREGEPFPWRFL
jgi:hypothetical protein